MTRSDARGDVSANAGPNLSGALWGLSLRLVLRRWVSAKVGPGWVHVTPVTDVAGRVAVAKGMSPELAAGFAHG